MMIIKAILSILLCISLLFGCSHEEEEKKNVEEVSKVSLGVQITDEGMFYIDGYTEMMKFYDFNLKTVIPLCDRPNCQHNSKECNAYLENGAWSVMGYYGGHIYYIDVSDIECPLYICDKNGANRKVLLKLNTNSEEYTCEVATNAIFAKNQLLIAVQYSPYTKILTGEIDWDMDVYNSQILGINLENGDIHILKEFKERPPSSNDLILDGYTEGKLIYYDRHTEKKYILDLDTLEEKELYDYNKTDTYNVEFSETLDKAYYVKYEEDKDRIFECDLSTGVERCLVEVEKKEERLCMAKLEETLYYGYYDDDGLWEDGTFGKYDITEDIHQEITKEEFWYMPAEGRMSEKWYCRWYSPKYYFISKEDFEKQDWEQAQVLDMY